MREVRFCRTCGCFCRSLVFLCIPLKANRTCLITSFVRIARKLEKKSILKDNYNSNGKPLVKKEHNISLVQYIICPLTMTDRLTQLQICLDQMTEQFCATLNYIDKNHGFERLTVNEPQMSDKHATVVPPEEFSSTIDELSTDIILKTRQINKLIDSLPGVDVSAEEQLRKIDMLQKKLVEVEDEKIEAIKKKEKLLRHVDSLIEDFVDGIANSKKST